MVNTDSGLEKSICETTDVSPLMSLRVETFGLRLSKLLDLLGAPPEGAGRATWLCQQCGVAWSTASRWTDSSSFIAAKPRFQNVSAFVQKLYERSLVRGGSSTQLVAWLINGHASNAVTEVHDTLPARALTNEQLVTIMIAAMKQLQSKGISVHTPSGYACAEKTISKLMRYAAEATYFPDVDDLEETARSIITLFQRSIGD